MLSYYKIDGPDAALVGIEVAKRKGARCIGEETSRMLKKDMSQSLGSATKSTKPLGEVHLQVSSFLKFSFTQDDVLFAISRFQQSDPVKLMTKNSMSSAELKLFI